jgi:hypothetical protein
LTKFAPTGFKELLRDGEIILQFEQPVDIYLNRKGEEVQIIILDKIETNKILNKIAAKI